MKKRELYKGTLPFAYIAFDYADCADTEELLDFLDENGYRYWFNSRITLNDTDITEVSERLNASCVAVIVLTENSCKDRLVSSVIENMLMKRCPIVIYITNETEEVSQYLGELLLRQKLIVFRAGSQPLSTSNSVRQALSEAKGITKSEAERLYEDGMKILRASDASPDDVAKAMKNVSLAAENEYPPALCFHGDIALAKARNGYDTYSSAVSYYRAASNEGYIDAIYKLGCMIADGEGFEADASSAAAYLAIAAIKGYADAQYRLAEMMDKGNGIEADRIEASSWYKKALAGGDRRAYMNLAYRYLNGDTLVKNEEIAAKYFIEAAKDGNKDACFMLAKLYRDGVGVKQNEEISTGYFLKAANAGIAEAQYYYAMALCKSKSYVEAFRWLNVAASGLKEGEKAAPEVLYEIGCCYDKGRGAEQNHVKAFLYFHDAAELGHAKAKAAVAECYKKGIGVPVNKKAAAYFEEEAGEIE